VTAGHTRNSFAKAGGDTLARSNGRLKPVNAGYPTGERRRWHAVTLKSTDQLGHVLGGAAQCGASNFFSADSRLKFSEMIRFRWHNPAARFCSKLVVSRSGCSGTSV